MTDAEAATYLETLDQLYGRLRTDEIPSGNSLATAFQSRLVLRVVDG